MIVKKDIFNREQIFYVQNVVIFAKLVVLLQQHVGNVVMKPEILLMVVNVKIIFMMMVILNVSPVKVNVKPAQVQVVIV